MDINVFALATPIILLVTASIAVIMGLYVTDTRASAALTLVGIFIAFTTSGIALYQVKTTGNALTSFNLHYVLDEVALGFTFVILFGLAMAVLISFDYIRRTGMDQPEYYPLLTLSTVGALVMVSAGDLITLVLGLEIMSLAVYVLSAWRDDVRESEEAGLKYFLLGAFASAFLIYGIVLAYGATGHFDYVGIAAGLEPMNASLTSPILGVLASILLLVGLGFKVAFAPFHQWVPDVYTGAPTSVTAYMSVVVKTAAFAGLLRVLAVFLPLSTVLTQVFVVLLLTTLIVGNLGALQQKNLKRILAYSAVAHAGYLGMASLSGLLSASAMIWYLTAYTFMNAGVFAILTLITDADAENFENAGDSFESLKGMGQKRPFLAAMLTLFFLSLAGIPPLAGFTAKVLVFQAALQAGYNYLAVFGILTSAVAVIYYFRPIVAMYFSDTEDKANTMNHSSGMAYTAIVLAALVTVVLGIFPSLWLDILQRSEQLLASF